MHTELLPDLLNARDRQQAQDILSRCVHCGFCTATCPTYQVLGDELDGPRGRIYLMKEYFERGEASRETQQHLDQCLQCLNCETTCPSGVEYGTLIEIGKRQLEQDVPRSWPQRIMRAALLFWIPSRRINPLYRWAQRLRPYLPRILQHHVLAAPASVDAWPALRHDRRVIIPKGCVQPAMAPNIDLASAQVLDALGVSTHYVAESQCCGAVELHLQQHERATLRARANIDAWIPLLDAGAEAIVITASGCGVMVKDYGELLADDPQYADKARRVSELACDPVELLSRLDLSALRPAPPLQVAFHPPCTLQHGQGLAERVEPILAALGFALQPVADKHLCCGSAGTYSVLQPQIARTLRDNKLHALGSAPIIATANIGCLHHLQSGTETPVQHWMELLAKHCLTASAE